MTDKNAGFRWTEETDVIERGEKRRKTIVKYLFLTACGLVLFYVGSIFAVAVRGYEAVGGEVLLFLVPFLICWIVSEVKNTRGIMEKDKGALRTYRDKKAHEEAVQGARDAVLWVLGDYPTDIWEDALGAAIVSTLTAKTDAAQIAEEEAAKRRIYE